VAPQLGRLQGWLSAAVGRLEQLSGGRVTAEDDGRERTLAGWLADVQRSTASAAGSQVRTARLLRSMPVVADAVLDGVLTPEQAAVLTRFVDTVEQAALLESAPDLVAVAAAMDPAQLARWVAHTIATHCEPALDAQASRARDKRYLQHRRDADGTLRGRFVLPAEDGEALLTALEPLARRAGLDDSRSAGQRRADALVEVCEQVLRHGDLPDAGGSRPQLSYVLPADWAAGQREQASCSSCGPRCADHRPPGFAATVRTALPGHPGVRAERACATAAWSGPQTRSRVEALLCDARITRVLLDSVGQVRGLEALADSVTPRQRRALAARDLGCVVRGCSRPPAMCDAHHLERRSDGGATVLGNLVLLCRRHHVLWHLGRLRLQHLHVPWHPDSRSSPPPGPIDAALPRAGP
jgi:Domain of unknown function (DUF222)